MIHGIVMLITDVWIIGSSYVYWAEIRADVRGIAKTLDTHHTIKWISRRGMRWSELMPKIQLELLHSPPPKMLVIHLGANDLCTVSTGKLYWSMKMNLQHFINLLPSTRVVFSALMPRKVWRGAISVKAIEQKRKHINFRIHGRMSYNNEGKFIDHKDISVDNPDVWFVDGVHLSDTGSDFFLADFRRAIEELD